MDRCSGRFVFKQFVVWLFIVLNNSNLATSWIEKSCFDSLQELEIFLLPKMFIQILGPKPPSGEWESELFSGEQNWTVTPI